MNNLLELEYMFSPNTILRNVKETTLVYNTDTSDMYELNDVGAELFNSLKNNTNMHDVFSEICKMYNVTIDVVFDDIECFVTRMIELGVVIPCN